MKQLGLGLALLLVVAACGDGTTTTEVAATSLRTTTTTRPATTTTTELPTTTTAQPAFQPAEQTEEDATAVLLMAATLLNPTPWSLDEMGDAWIEMLRDAPIAACLTLHDGGSLAEAAYAAMQQTPLASLDPTEYPPEASSLWALFAVSAMPRLCPELVEGFADDAVRLTNVWQELIGGERLDSEAVITDGTWIVGDDIQPGTYANTGSAGCYWERLSGFSGTIGDVIANGLSDDRQIVTIQAGDAGFHTDDCGTWDLVE